MRRISKPVEDLSLMSDEDLLGQMENAEANHAEILESKQKIENKITRLKAEMFFRQLRGK